jgi:PilZ domain
MLGGAVQKFDYRVPRFLVDLPVQFTIQDSTLRARCIEISKEGMRVELQEPLPANACGSVLIRYRDRLLQLDARIAHVGETHGGVVFVYRSDSERIAVANLVLALAESRPNPVPIPVA